MLSTRDFSSSNLESEIDVSTTNTPLSIRTGHKQSPKLTKEPIMSPVRKIGQKDETKIVIGGITANTGPQIPKSESRLTDQSDHGADIEDFEEEPVDSMQSQGSQGLQGSMGESRGKLIDQIDTS